MHLIVGKKYYGCLLGLLCILLGMAQDIPPGTSTPTNFPQGSIIIPMNKAIQTKDNTFNLRTYGLVYRLLQEGIDVSWVIKNDKQKDAMDLLVRATPLHTTDAVWLELVSGCFIINIDQLYEQDCIGITKKDFDIRKFLKNHSFEDIEVYESVEQVEADVRYVLHHPPAIAVLTDGDYHFTHAEVYSEAGIPYGELDSRTFFEKASCYNVISQPHIEMDQIENEDYFEQLDAFLKNGGNFIGQCSSIGTFENESKYHYSGGVEVMSTFEEISFMYDYYHADQAIMQFEGELPEVIIGTVSGYKPKANGALRPNAFEGIKHGGYTFLSSADVNGAAVGGNIIYISGHDYGGFTGASSDVQQFKRILLNSLFIPAGSNFACAGENICICNGEEVQLGCKGLSPNLSYRWVPSIGLSCSDCPNPIARPSKTTTYTLTVEGDASCGSSSVVVKVLNNEPVELGDDLLLCENDERRLDATVDGASQYRWSDGDTSAQKLLSESGTYKVSVTTETCEMVDSVHVLVLHPDFLGPDKEVCDELFEIDPGLPIDILWNDMTIARRYAVQKSGWYRAEIQTGSCSVVDSIQVSIVDNDLQLPDTLEKCVSETITLDAGMGDYIQWTTGENTEAIDVYTPGYYYVSKRVSTCRFIDSVLVKNISCGECVLDYPNIFSPNTDNSNDFWMLLKQEDCLLTHINVKIYDRWGTFIYQTNELDRPWDGMYKSAPAPIGVYVFSAEVEDSFGEIHVQQGDFLLVR